MKPVKLSTYGWNLSSFQVGLTWSKKSKSSLVSSLKKILGDNHEDHDLDLIACLLNKEGHIVNLGHTIEKGSRPVPLVNSDVIYFHNLSMADESVIHSGDNQTGEQKVDDEVITVFPDRLSARFNKIVFMALLFDAKSKGLDFGHIEGADIVMRDGRKKVISRMSISDGPADSCALTFAELVREDKGWVCQPIKQFHNSDSLAELLRPYISL
ncbi:MAG: TerD family protein [Bacteroidia bacterium]